MRAEFEKELNKVEKAGSFFMDRVAKDFDKVVSAKIGDDSIILKVNGSIGEVEVEICKEDGVWFVGDLDGNIAGNDGISYERLYSLVGFSERAFWNGKGRARIKNMTRLAAMIQHGLTK